MSGGLTLDEARALFEADVDPAWYASLVATADGVALLDAALAIVVEADRRDAADAGALVAETATRASLAHATVFVARSRPGEALRVPAGTFVESADHVRFELDDDVILAEGAVGVLFDTTCTADRPGNIGVFPAGTIDRFSPLLETLSGAGIALAVVVDGAFRRVKLTTDASQPHPFRQSMLGLYVTIADDDGAHAANVGRLVQIVAVNDGSSPGAVGDVEDTVAWSAPFVPTSPQVAHWSTGRYAYTWRVVSWVELGLTVTNIDAASLGTSPSLDALALVRGIVPSSSDSAEVVRRKARLAPQPPVPLGLLRKVLQAFADFGQDLSALRIYEPGAPAPSATLDPYATNFPAWGGFLADVHCANMADPETPDVFVTHAPYGVTVPGAHNPGLGLPFDGRETRVLVRWDEGATAELTARPIRVAILLAASKARPPGVAIELYRSTQHGYPNP
jgi:hypothetical protein